LIPTGGSKPPPQRASAQTFRIHHHRPKSLTTLHNSLQHGFKILTTLRIIGY
jgi:hypothetical protein